jgi:GTPase SAR1 family protein
VKGAYIIGAPGAGKSTLLRELTKDVEQYPMPKPFAHIGYFRGDRVVAKQIGGVHAKFPGTDRLSMSVQPKALEWIAQAPAPMIFGEGDRLATTGFLTALGAACSTWNVILLDTPPGMAAKRRALRGGNQAEAWVAGRITKVRRLAEEFADHLVTIDGALDLKEQVSICRGLDVFSWIQ